MQTSQAGPHSSHKPKNELMVSSEPCHACIKPGIGEERYQEDFVQNRFSLRNAAVTQSTILRRAYSASALREGFTHTLRRLRRGTSAKEDNIPRLPTREADIVPQVDGPYEHIPSIPSKAASHLVSPRRQQITCGQDSCSVLQKPGAASKCSEATINGDAQHEEVAQVNDGFGDVSMRSFETTVLPRHSAATPDYHNKPRSTYTTSNNHGNSTDKMDEQFGMRDSVMSEMGATMVDLRSDLEWLDPRTTLHRDFSMRNRTILEEGKRSPSKSMPKMDEDGVEREDATKGGKRISESLPELEREYQSSDSGVSIAEELLAKHWTPTQTMLNLLPDDVDGRFGSFYSVLNQPRVHGTGLVDKEMDWRCSNTEPQVSRFSWGSSIYSDAGGDPVIEGDVWWKIKPLVVKKEISQPPPIPERNPLRLMKRVSKSFPKGFGRSVRASRNIHNLRLDLSRPSSKSDARKSLRDSVPSRRRSNIPAASKDVPKPVRSASQPSLALPGHILDAMRSSVQSTQRYANLRETKGARGSARTNATSTIHHLTTSQYGLTKRSKEARGHTRANSEPHQQSGINRSIPNKWNEPMPSDGCVRRSCIAGLANEVKPRRSDPTLCINKQLPPLPVSIES
jgi:hypothetical protein